MEIGRNYGSSAERCAAFDLSGEQPSLQKRIKAFVTGRTVPPANLKIIMEHSILSNCGRFLFVKNSKAGCTSLSNLVYEWQYGRAPPSGIHSCQDLRQGTRHQSDILKALFDPHVKRFTTVRDPVARAISGFIDTCVEAKNPGLARHRVFLENFGYRSEENLSFNLDVFLDYLDYCLAANPLATDRHFRRQVNNIGHGVVSYTAVGALENLKDFARLLKDILPGSVPLFPRSNVKGVALDVSPQQRARIKRLYQADVASLGYEEG